MRPGIRIGVIVIMALVGVFVVTGRAAAAECSHAHFPGDFACARVEGNQERLPVMASPAVFTKRPSVSPSVK